MKLKAKLTIIATVFILVTAGTIVIAQNRDTDPEKTEKTSSKEIKVEIINGEKTVTIKTNENGDEKVEILKGKEADEYLANEENLHGNFPGSQKHCEKIIMNLDDEIDLSEIDDFLNLAELEDLDTKIKEEIQNILSNIDININEGDFSMSIDDEQGGKIKMKIITNEDGEEEVIEDFDIDVNISSDSSQSKTKKKVIKKVIIIDEEEENK